MEKKSASQAVRRQYHDLKNLMLYVEKQPSNENLHSHLSKMLSSMQPIENQLETGNEAFDIMMNSKLADCRQRHIACSVMADGGLLNSLPAFSLVTIVGNAMDNAMEACGRLPAGTEAFIQVKTLRKPGFFVLMFRNSCAPQVDASSLRTTKKDPERHGFGLENIRRAAEENGGSVSCSAAEGVFTLSLLFPCRSAGEDQKA